MRYLIAAIVVFVIVGYLIDRYERQHRDDTRPRNPSGRPR
jgi:F0F1-type ATP synthase assembly protein I